MAKPPTGKVTFLFTDIEGSTRLWERAAKRMQRALARYGEILQEAIAAHGGYACKTMGDACYAAFCSTPKALEATLSAQRAILRALGPEVCRVRVRMALNTGEAEKSDGGYFGPPFEPHIATPLCQPRLADARLARHPCGG